MFLCSHIFMTITFLCLFFISVLNFYTKFNFISCSL
nr:MAG TPA: hypothetical protein [Caudoviricetes sp.]